MVNLNYLSRQIQELLFVLKIKKKILKNIGLELKQFKYSETRKRINNKDKNYNHKINDKNYKKNYDKRNRIKYSRIRGNIINRRLCFHFKISSIKII